MFEAISIANISPTKSDIEGEETFWLELPERLTSTMYHYQI